MSAGTIDLSRATLVLGITGTIPPSGDGTFFTGDFPAVVEAGPTMADGQAVRIVRQPNSAEYVLTCGKHSEAHRLMGAKWNRESAQRNARIKLVGETLRAVDPTNGDILMIQDCVVAQPPGAALSNDVTVQWTLHGMGLEAQYGTLIPIGGGSL